MKIKFTKKTVIAIFGLAICTIVIADYLVGILLTYYRSYSYSISFFAFLLISLMLCFFFLVLPYIFSNDNSLEKKYNDDIYYIKSGYEEKLSEVLLNNNINSLFINGEFGTGKTTLLNYVLKNNIKVDIDKVLFIKFYDEYIEDNFIEFLFERLNKHNIISRNIHILIPTLLIASSAVLLFFMMEVTNKSEPLLFLIVLILLFKEALSQFNFKYNKIEYIKKEIAKYEYIVIDDLDRAYISTSEIMKCVHFLSENSQSKLILLGDSSKFTSTTNNQSVEAIDLLEKYYDYKFEIPLKILVDKLVQILERKILKVYPIDYKDDLSKLFEIWKKMTPRKLIKIIEQIEFDENSLYYEITNNLYRSDYLFIITLSVNNEVSFPVLKEVLNELKKYINLDNENDEMIEKVNLLSNPDIKLNDAEYNYLVDAFAYHHGCSTSKGRKHQLMTNFRVEKIFYNRLLDQVEAYMLNSYASSITSIQEIHKEFETWLENTPSKITNYEYKVYCELHGDDKTNEMLTRQMEVTEQWKFMYFVENYILNHRADVMEKYPNTYYKYLLYHSNGFKCQSTFNEIKKVYKELLPVLSIGNIVDILRRSVLLSEIEVTDEIRKWLIDNELESKAIDFLISENYPYLIFEMFGDKKVASESQIESLLELKLDYLIDIKQNRNYYGFRPGVVRRDEGDNDIKEFNEFKKKVSKYYTLDITKYRFSFDD